MLTRRQTEGTTTPEQLSHSSTLSAVASHSKAMRVTSPARQVVRQPDDGLPVQVVGGLVEQQDIAVAHHRGGEQQLHAPAAGELVDML